MRREKEQSGFFKKSSGKDDDSTEEEDPAGVAHIKRKHIQDTLRKGAEGDQAKAETFHLMVKPKYWSTNPLIRLVEEAVLERAAHAEGNTDDQGGDGSKAAEILMALAAIVAAAAPMVAAAIQADADKKIAKINADTAIRQTEITADTSKYMANKQEEVAIDQANTAKAISEQNNEFQTKRLDDQLAELKSARQDARQAEEQKQQIEMQYNQERIALAQKQSDDNKKLAMETLNANLTQAGLTNGFTNAQPAGQRLTESMVNSRGTNSVASNIGGGGSSSSGGGGGMMGGGLGAGASAGLGAGLGGPGGPGGAGGGAGLGIKMDGSQSGQLLGITDAKGQAAAKATLLAANGANPKQNDPATAQNGSAKQLLAGLNEIEGNVSGANKATLRGINTTAKYQPSRGIASLHTETATGGTSIIGHQLQALLENNLSVRGSTPKRKNRTLATTKEPTDLSKFMERTKVTRINVSRSEPDSGLASFLRSKPVVRTSDSGRPHAQSHVPNAAYNAPDSAHAIDSNLAIRASAGLFGTSTHGN